VTSRTYAKGMPESGYQVCAQLAALMSRFAFREAAHIFGVTPSSVRRRVLAALVACCKSGPHTVLLRSPRHINRAWHRYGLSIGTASMEGDHERRGARP
jgi:hypothetical protein